MVDTLIITITLLIIWIIWEFFKYTIKHFPPYRGYKKPPPAMPKPTQTWTNVEKARVVINRVKNKEEWEDVEPEDQLRSMDSTNPKDYIGE